MSINVYEIITSICAIVVSLVLMSISTYFRNKLKESKYTDLVNKVSTAVNYAEQMFGSGNGDKKYTFATQFIHMLVDDDEYDPDVIKGIIEALVYNLNQGKNATKMEELGNKINELLNNLIALDSVPKAADAASEECNKCTLLDFPTNNNDNNDKKDDE